MNTPTQTPIHRGLRTGQQPQRPQYEEVTSRIEVSTLTVVFLVVLANVTLLGFGLWKVLELIFK